MRSARPAGGWVGLSDVSVNIVVTIQSGEDIVAIYAEMKKDPRVKWLI